MKTDSTNACPKCGAAVPPEAPQGLCPRCVLAAASAPEPAPTATSQIPSLERLAVAFPQLQIIELIGRGGMGFVFKARQPHLDRFVALKLLPDSLAHDPQFAERFNREGRVLARLNHPNIVSIFDFGHTGAPISKSASPSDAPAHADLEIGAPPQTQDAISHPQSGFYYLMMEYVDGVNLRQAMQAGRFSPAEALTIVPKICEALQFAHEEGILHRDIKPENILLDAKGRVKIADFGIAKLVGEEHPDGSLTATGAALGTMHYMAPEQIEKPSMVDHRADIYSLGVVFYELLTGELPLGRFGPPSAKTPVDSRVDDVVMRTLEREREKRFQSAGEMGTTVEHLTEVGAGANPPRPATLASPDFILCHPRLPRMAQLLTVYALVVAPVLWFIGLATMDNTPSSNAYAAFIEAMMRLGTFWGELLTTVLLFIGGWKLRALKKSGPPIIRVALWMNMVILSLVIGGIVWIEMLAPGGEAKPMSPGDALLAVTQLGSLIFQIIALVWLRRNRAVLNDIFQSAATPRGPHGTMVIPPSAVVSQASSPRPSSVLKWVLIGLVLSALGLVVQVIPNASWLRAPFRAGSKSEVHYRVFEVESAAADNLVPAAQRQTGATGNWQMADLSPETLAALMNARVLKKHVMVDRHRTVPTSMPLSTTISSRRPGVKEAQRQVVVGWPIVSDNWGHSLRVSNDIVAVDGSGFFGVRRQNGVLQLKMEHLVTHKIGNRPAVDVNIAYEGNAPQTGALTFFIPFARADDTTGYYLLAVEVLEAGTKAGRPATPPSVNTTDTNTTPWIRFTFTAVELREVQGVRWLAIDYLDDVHGECDKSFPWENTIPGFMATTRATEFITDAKDGSPSVRHQRIEYRMPDSSPRDQLERLRDNLEKALQRKSFRLELGENEVPLLLFELPGAEGGSLQARIKVVPPQTVPITPQRTLGALRLVGAGSFQNLALVNLESMHSHPLHYITARFSGPELPQEVALAPKAVNGPYVLPSANEDIAIPVTEPIANGDPVGTNQAPTASAIRVECPSIYSMSFVLPDENAAREANRQIKQALAGTLTLKTGQPIVLFTIGERKAWLEVHPFYPAPNKLAFFRHGGRSPASAASSNHIECAVATIPPGCELELVGRLMLNGQNRPEPAFGTTLTSGPNEPGVYWLTWYSLPNPQTMDDGVGEDWELLVHDVMGHELLRVPAPEELKRGWSRRWVGESKRTAKAGEPIQQILFQKVETNRAGDRRPSYVNLEMTMHRTGAPDR